MCSNPAGILYPTLSFKIHCLVVPEPLGAFFFELLYTRLALLCSTDIHLFKPLDLYLHIFGIECRGFWCQDFMLIATTFCTNDRSSMTSFFFLVVEVAAHVVHSGRLEGRDVLRGVLNRSTAWLDIRHHCARREKSWLLVVHGLLIYRLLLLLLLGVVDLHGRLHHAGLGIGIRAGGAGRVLHGVVSHLYAAGVVVAAAPGATEGLTGHHAVHSLLLQLDMLELSTEKLSGTHSHSIVAGVGRLLVLPGVAGRDLHGNELLCSGMGSWHEHVARLLLGHGSRRGLLFGGGRDSALGRHGGLAGLGPLQSRADGLGTQVRCIRRSGRARVVVDGARIDIAAATAAARVVPAVWVAGPAATAGGAGLAVARLEVDVAVL